MSSGTHPAAALLHLRVRLAAPPLRTSPGAPQTRDGRGQALPAAFGFALGQEGKGNKTSQPQP